MASQMKWRTCFVLVAVLAASPAARGEATSPFWRLIDQCDYIAQFQVHTRNGKPIGRRLVQVYWKANGFDDTELTKRAKPWRLYGFDSTGRVRLEDHLKREPRLSDDFFYRVMDGVLTEFVFHGRGQHLMTRTAENGVILYPGGTAEPGVEAEIACGDAEFHEILERLGELKRAGESVKGKLELTIFGSKHLAR